MLNKTKQNNNNNIKTKSPNVFNYLESLNQEAKDLIDEIDDVNNDIDNGKLFFIGSNKEKRNFNTFNKPLDFISPIYNGEISLKEAEFKQKKYRKKIKNLRDYKNNEEEKEKEEINGVLMQANDLLEHRNKIIDAFKDGTFSSEHLKKTDNAAYIYVLKDVKDFTQKIELMSEKINLSLSEDFFESQSPAMYAKMVINTENPDKNKEFVPEIKERISNLKEGIREMGEKEKKLKMLMTH